MALSILGRAGIAVLVAALLWVLTFLGIVLLRDGCGLDYVLPWYNGAYDHCTTRAETVIGPIFDFDDLRRISRLGDRATLAIVERWARRIGLKYDYDGRGGIWTTTDAMNAAVGIVAKASEPELYSVDDV